MATWGKGLLAWTTLVAAVVLACGKSRSVGSDGSAGAASTGGSVATNPSLVAPTTVAALCETYPAAWGDLMARCYGGEAADWASRWDLSCSEAALAEEAGRIALNEANVANCFAVLAGGECLFSPWQSGSQCSDLVTGGVPVGQPCTILGYGDECVPDAYCDPMGACGGTCAPKGIEGEGCAGPYVTVICAPGLDCAGPSGVCTVPAAVGEPCAGQLCQVGLYCDAADGDEGTCQPLKTAGPCQNDGTCATGFKCIQSDAGEGACTRVKPTGAPCTVGLRECAGYCSPERICRVVAEEGESCGFVPDITSGALPESIPCAAGLFCDRLSTETSDAICRRQLPVGAAWPETTESGSPCDGIGSRTFRDPSTDVCAICD